MRLYNAKDILFHPSEEWSRMQEEEQNRGSLLRYGVTCLAISHVILILWILIYAVNRGSTYYPSYGLLYWIVAIFLRFGMGLISLWVLPFLVAELAPSFQGRRDSLSALKLYVFALTPTWAGMICGSKGMFFTSIYSIYLLWKYADVALEIPPLKKVSFVVVVAFIFDILQWVFYGIGMSFAKAIIPISAS